ncbi:MAG: Lrp/AsnC family transcriptional regulator [Peptococcaceae bacterium]
MQEILELLENEARLSTKEIAFMLNLPEEEVRRKIKELEENKTILRYLTIINWEKAGEEKVTALIEVRLTPQRDIGFDAIAERIYRFPEVKSVYLMSGVYDLAVFVEGLSMKEVSNFVATRLATIEGVTRTATHFVMKTFKREGVILEDQEQERRLVISP